MEDGEQERVARSNYKNQKQTFFFNQNKWSKKKEK